MTHDEMLKKIIIKEVCFQTGADLIKFYAPWVSIEKACKMPII